MPPLPCNLRRLLLDVILTTLACLTLVGPGFGAEGSSFTFTRGRNLVMPSGVLELSNIPPGRYRVRIEKPPLDPVVTTVLVVPSEWTTVRLTLR